MSYLIIETTDDYSLENTEYTIYESHLIDTKFDAIKFACGLIQHQFTVNNGEGVVDCFLPNELTNANIFNNLLNKKDYINAFRFYCKNPFLNFEYKIVYGGITSCIVEPKQLGNDYLLKKSVFE